MSFHTPNPIPAEVRAANVLLSAALLAYGAFGVYMNALYVPGRRSGGVVLQGPAAWLLAAAMGCAAANLLAVVLDHYDGRDNERSYRLFGRAAQLLAWLLVAASVLAAVWAKLPRPGTGW